MGHIQTEPAGRPSKPHKTAAELERTTCPAQKEEERSKDGVLQASLPSRSSCWDVSAVLQNSTGEQPVPLVGTSTHSGKPPSFQAHGDRGARSGSMGSGRPANVLRRSTERGWGAGSRGCAMHHQKRSLHQRCSWWPVCHLQGGRRAAGSTQLPRYGF